MHDDEALGALQEALLDELARAASPAEARAALLSSPACAPYRDWIAGFELRSLAVAMELVRKWGVRTRSATEAREGARGPKLAEG